MEAEWSRTIRYKSNSLSCGGSDLLKTYHSQEMIDDFRLLAAHENVRRHQDGEFAWKSIMANRITPLMAMLLNNQIYCTWFNDELLGTAIVKTDARIICNIRKMLAISSFLYYLILIISYESDCKIGDK